MEKVTIKLPLLVTRGLLVFPEQISKIEVGRSKSIVATSIAQTDFAGQIIVCSQKDPNTETPGKDDFYHDGSIAQVQSVHKNVDGSMTVIYKGIKKVKVTEVIDAPESFYALAEEIKVKPGKKTEEAALVRQIAQAMETMVSEPTQILPPDVIAKLASGIDALELADAIAHHIPTSIPVKVEMISETSLNKLLNKVLLALKNEREIEEIESRIFDDMKRKMDKQQRDFYLREKIKAFKDELGEGQSSSDLDKVREFVESNPFPESVKNKIIEELDRYETVPTSSPESSVIKNYVDWMTKTPWWQQTNDNDDLVKVRNVLDKGHFGLEKIKERIVEYLAVKQMTNSLKSPILCLVGPPGVGKTSLAYSIAEAIDRKFVKVALGGVRDESEIRGHRRTYVGAMPGRIIQGMKKAGVINPVFLLDEIDKMASDYRGDPSSAMLEVLDPEQNKQFSDHYMEEPYDLSKVMFIATANYIENIPAPLRDRMEIIQLSSYTEQEKVNIANKYLITKSLKDHGLKKTQFSIASADVLYIVRRYTREAGVRQLERLINQLVRKAVVRILAGEKAIKITKELIVEMLGKEKFDHTKSEETAQVGVTTGLAYTQFGGDILPVEATYFDGKGKFIVTGQLGDVMKESAQIALGYVRANAEKYKIKNEVFEKKDIHIHVPEGAIPKDGPSAGITMTTSIISALTNTPVRKDVGMTGEINLRGQVLPIGGLKEKAISAHRSGLKTIIIPKENERDLDDIPQEVKKSLKIIPVSTIKEVLDIAFKK